MLVARDALEVERQAKDTRLVRATPYRQAP